MRLIIERLPNMLAILLLAMLSGGLLSACKSESTTPASVMPGISIGITDGICPNVTVQVGDQVTWTNTGKQDHIVRHVPDQGTSQIDSGSLGPGNNFAFTFVEAGSYPYICSADGVMTGIVTVNP